MQEIVPWLERFQAMPNQKTNQVWDPKRYAKEAGFVSALGLPVVELLAPKSGERMLDLGCGDGTLALKLMCRRSGMIFVSVGYRHAPEHRFPTAVEDGYAATRWIAEHAAELGGTPGPVMVAGWSAGGNIAAVTCQLARDRWGPPIAGQLLICPVTDCVFDRPSYNENATGYFLTRSLMYWFWDIYCSPADRTDPRVSPLRGKLAGLPPAFVATCEFDPLRDEGIAYAEALGAAGVPVEQLMARGHFHGSVDNAAAVVSIDLAAALKWHRPHSRISASMVKCFRQAHPGTMS